MGWERRQRGGRYYTRSRRVAGRVVREYVGGGVVGSLAAGLDAAERAKAQEQARAWRKQRDELELAETLAEQFVQAADSLMRSALVVGGYHQHHRGEWRRRRG